MKLEDRNKRMEEIFKEDLELSKRKGHDYSGEEDCMANLRIFGFPGVIVRLGDKFFRLKSFVEQGILKVRDESILDTLRDLRVYGALAQILYEEEQQTGKTPQAALYKKSPMWKKIGTKEENATKSPDSTTKKD